MPRGLAFLALVLSTLVAVPAAVADQNDPRLDGLFDRLRSTGDAAAADRIEQQIWRVWTETDNSIARELMAEGMRAMAGRRLTVALDRFERAVAVAPRFAEAWNRRATVHYMMGEYDESVRDIRRVLELEPRHFGALSGLALIYDALDEEEAALRTLEAALAINPHLEGAEQRVDELRSRVGGRET